MAFASPPVGIFADFRGFSAQGRLNGILFRLHGPQGHIQQLIQLPAQKLRALGDHIPGAPGGKFFVLELLFQRLQFHILGALGVGILYHAGLTACIRLYPGRRGFASGLFTGASGIASFFVAPFAMFMLDITNVKFAFKAIALCFTVFTLFAFVMARREEKCVHTITETDNLNDCSWKLLIKDRNFKFVFTAFLFGAVPGVSLIGHAAAIGVELIDLTPWVAAMMVSIIAVANFIGRIIFGWVSDKIGNEHTLIISGILSFSAIILLSISKDILMFIIAIVIICMGFGCIFAVFPSLVAELFRTQEEPPVVFEIVEPIPEAPSNTSEAPKEPDTEEIIQPQLDPIKPLELPEPEPEPEPESEPKPEPVPQPKPEPKPEKKIEKPPVPQKVSYADFIKQNPKKKQRPKTTSYRKQKIKYDKVSADTGSLDNLDARITSNIGSNRAMQNELGAYVQYIHSMARRNWVIPSSIVGEELTARIEFRVGANGTISGVRILSKSGNADFDNSVVNLFKVLNLNPPPDGKAHTITLNFRSLI